MGPLAFCGLALLLAIPEDPPVVGGRSADDWERVIREQEWMSQELLHHGEQGAGVWLNLAGSKEPTVRRAAATALCEFWRWSTLHAEDVRAAFLRLGEDPDAGVRAWAGVGLVRLLSPESPREGVLPRLLIGGTEAGDAAARELARAAGCPPWLAGELERGAGAGRPAPSLCVALLAHGLGTPGVLEEARRLLLDAATAREVRVDLLGAASRSPPSAAALRPALLEVLRSSKDRAERFLSGVSLAIAGPGGSGRTGESPVAREGDDVGVRIAISWAAAREKGKPPDEALLREGRTSPYLPIRMLVAQIDLARDPADAWGLARARECLRSDVEGPRAQALEGLVWAGARPAGLLEEAERLAREDPDWHVVQEARRFLGQKAASGTPR